VAVGDFNGDSNPDLAVANTGADDVSVLLDGPVGTFSFPHNFDAGAAPASVAGGGGLTSGTRVGGLRLRGCRTESWGHSAVTTEPTWRLDLLGGGCARGAGGVSGLGGERGIGGRGGGAAAGLASVRQR